MIMMVAVAHILQIPCNHFPESHFHESMCTKPQTLHGPIMRVEHGSTKGW